MVTMLSVVYAIFVLGSLFSGGWYREAFKNLQAGAKPANLKIGAWVQAAWMYAAPSWFFWGWPWGVLIWIVLGAKLTVAVAAAESAVAASYGTPTLAQRPSTSGTSPSPLVLAQSAALSSDGRHLEAIDSIRALLKRQPNDALAWAALGTAYAAWGALENRPNAVREIYSNLMRLDPQAANRFLMLVPAPLRDEIGR
jgi:hypothetical protein